VKALEMKAGSEKKGRDIEYLKSYRVVDLESCVVMCFCGVK